MEKEKEIYRKALLALTMVQSLLENDQDIALDVLRTTTFEDLFQGQSLVVSLLLGNLSEQSGLTRDETLATVRNRLLEDLGSK